MSKLPKQFEAFRQHLPKLAFETIFDVGSHLGAMTQAYRLAAPAAKIHAFEPVKATHEQLAAALAGDSLTIVSDLALADASGEGAIVANKTSAANRMVSLGGSTTRDRIQTVRQETGDRYCQVRGIERVNLLKIQTEGFDLSILKGFEGMLKAQQIDLVEVEAALHLGNTTHVQIEALKGYLEPLGYSIFGFFGAAMEKDRPQLRRAHVVFVSKAMVDLHRAAPPAPPVIAAEPAAKAEPPKPMASVAPAAPREKPGQIGPETALTLVFNAKYTEPVQVLLYSIQKNGNIPKAPLVIITDDVTVAEHPLFKRLAHQIELVDEATLAKFGTIKGERVPEHLKTYFAPKYTFLKFLLFKNRGYKRHIFMDADMLCLGALDHELLTSDFEAKAVLETSGDYFPVRDEPRDKFDPEKSRQMIERRSMPKTEALGRNVNSGFLTLQGAALGEEVFENALRIASDAAFVQEQAATSEMFRTREGIRFMELPIWYNFKRRIFDALGEEYFEDNKHRVKILHYIPGKPWKFGPKNRSFVDHQWWQYREESMEWAADMQNAMV